MYLTLFFEPIRTVFRNEAVQLRVSYNSRCIGYFVYFVSCFHSHNTLRSATPKGNRSPYLLFGLFWFGHWQGVREITAVVVHVRDSMTLRSTPLRFATSPKTIKTTLRRLNANRKYSITLNFSRTTLLCAPSPWRDAHCVLPSRQ